MNESDDSSGGHRGTKSMSKTKVIWISREKDGFYEIWSKEPHKKKGWWTGTYYMGRISNVHVKKYFGIRIKKGGLAKVTIERQY